MTIYVKKAQLPAEVPSVTVPEPVVAVDETPEPVVSEPVGHDPVLERGGAGGYFKRRKVGKK